MLRRFWNSVEALHISIHWEHLAYTSQQSELQAPTKVTDPNLPKTPEQFLPEKSIPKPIKDSLVQLLNSKQRDGLGVNGVLSEEHPET